MSMAILPWHSLPNFGIRGNVGLLDWYTISVAVFAVVMLAAHGATYLTLKTEGPVHDRSASYAMMLWPVLGPLGVIVSVETWFVRQDMLGHAVKNPFTWLGLIVVATSVVTLATGIRKRLEFRAFIGSTFLIAGLIGTAAAAIFPVMLYSTLAPENSLTAFTPPRPVLRPSGGAGLVAGGLYPGRLLLCLHLSTLCRQSKHYSRQSGLLLNCQFRELVTIILVTLANSGAAPLSSIPLVLRIIPGKVDTTAKGCRHKSYRRQGVDNADQKSQCPV